MYIARILSLYTYFWIYAQALDLARDFRCATYRANSFQIAFLLDSMNFTLTLSAYFRQRAIEIVKNYYPSFDCIVQINYFSIGIYWPYETPHHISTGYNTIYTAK